MKLDRFKIRNYRSYDETGDIEFDSKSILVGENNAGKSNIFRALDMFLEISPTTPHDIDDTHLLTGDTITIEAWFTNLTESERDEFSKYIVDGELWVRTDYPFDEDRSPVNKEFIVQTQVPAISDFRGYENKEASEVTKIYQQYESLLKPHRPDNWGGEYKKYIIPTIDNYVADGDPETIIEKRTDPHGIKNSLKAHLPEFRYFEADRDIEDETKTSTSALLGQLLDGALSDVDENETDKIRDALEDVDDKLNKSQKFDEIQSLEQDLKQKLNRHIPLDDLSITVEIPDLDSILNNVSISIDDGVETRISTMGAGLHTSFILACLWELAERGGDDRDVIFGLEEPENDLHPHAQRQLYDTLKDLSGEGYQVLLSTHSSFLVSSDDILDIHRIGKPNQSSQIHSVSATRFEPAEIEKIQRKLTTENNELFFSRLVLLCEGASEKWALPMMNSILDANESEVYAFDRLGVSVLNVEGKSGIPPLLEVTNMFNIPSIALIDNDSDVDDGHANKREQIKDQATKLIELSDDLENTFFQNITFAQFCEAMSQTDCGFEKTEADLEKAYKNSGHPKSVVMKNEFNGHNPSKPLLARALSSELSADQLGPEIIELMETAREMAIRR
ncbi:ATP-dependent nuclease [Haloferax volcanii]|uniref:ATP-dependent nuclease n=1 Tax=Haloferax volcanii TaxID=2246 RepID=UPI00249B9302|nr:AAA family ATPase [Haloferax alexandrinus]